MTIGVYDGVHLGHHAVLRLVRELADARDLDAVCVTFDRHPAEVVRPESAPKLLTTPEQKLELLDATGYLDRCFVLHFDEARSREPAEDFVREVLVDGRRRRGSWSSAPTSTSARGRGGNVALLERMGAELGFEVVGLGLEAARRGRRSTRRPGSASCSRRATSRAPPSCSVARTRCGDRSRWATSGAASSGSRPPT